MNDQATNFWELFERSIITQSLITFLLVATTCAMLLLQMDVPTWYIAIVTTVVGFWTGTKSQFEINRAYNRIQESLQNGRE